MPVVYQNPTYPWQVSFSGQQAVTTQLNYRQMLSEVTSWNPDLDPMQAGRFINNYYRKVIDIRSWYGLKLKGQINVNQPVNNGQVTCTLGSPFVTGINTNWTTAPANVLGSLVGMQFRTGFTYGYQTITAVLSPSQLQLDTPFIGASGTNTTGYQIVSCYVDFGANIKRVLWAVNQQMGWTMGTNVPQQSINEWDTWRENLGWSRCLSPLSMSPSGSALYEVWPTPFSTQTFPFEAYQQPPDLAGDTDSVVPWIATDLIVKRASVDAIFHPTNRKRDAFSLEAAKSFLAEFDKRLVEMELSDNDIDQQDVTWDYGAEEGGAPGIGSFWTQSHDA